MYRRVQKSEPACEGTWTSTHISGVVLVDFDQLICSGVLRVNPAGGSAPQPCGVQVMPHLHNALRVVLAPALVEGVVLHG